MGTARHEPPLHVLVPRAYDLGEIGVDRLLVALAGRPGLVALDSAGGAPRRHSIVGFDPLESFGLGTGSSPGGPRRIRELRPLLDRYALAPDAEVPGPFRAGFLGAIAYDHGAAAEELELPAAAWPVPPVVGGIYRDWVVVDHRSGRATAVLCDVHGQPGPVAEERLRTLEADLEGAPPTPTHRDRLPDRPARGRPFRRMAARDRHMAAVERTRALIAEGEIYQANISHRCLADGGPAPAPLELYLALREVNPAPYMTFLPFAHADGTPGAIVSASPELLAEVDPPGAAGAARARTRPIKGTIRRGADPEEDAVLAARLLASEKDRAELAMIVDLERNDLGRIATPGSVRVHGFPTLETYPTVHHLVADVTATLAPGRDAVDVLESLFPGGSITGAPKLRSMEVIAELEGEGRGFFTGSAGYLGLDGGAAFNILIRTLIHRGGAGGGEVSFHVGGGITWSSSPSSEDDETLTKAEGLARALRAASPDDPVGTDSAASRR